SGLPIGQALTDAFTQVCGVSRRARGRRGHWRGLTIGALGAADYTLGTSGAFLDLAGGRHRALHRMDAAEGTTSLARGANAAALSKPLVLIGRVCGGHAYSG